MDLPYLTRARTRYREAIFGAAIRVSGLARWECDRDGRWHQIDFTIKDFEVLNDEPLSDVVHKLQSIDAEWKTPDALRRLREINSGEDN